MDSSIPTYFLAHWVREQERFTWEEAISMLTSRPALEFGLSGRGLLREGYVADVVVFDPETIGPRLPSALADLPAGGTRSGARGRRDPRLGGVGPGAPGQRRLHRCSTGSAHTGKPATLQLTRGSGGGPDYSRTEGSLRICMRHIASKRPVKFLSRKKLPYAAAASGCISFPPPTASMCQACRQRHSRHVARR